MALHQSPYNKWMTSQAIQRFTDVISIDAVNSIANKFQNLKF